ncbi:YbgA family protein [Clostridium weizhouense]|uniref:DUF523 and DUF1722 domain-containing protein n=1 Tax=Clostridium weizhouense TaxID=2859781 RepID=A0ABS7AQ14_9CLOT|nr:DUF523 and DUF1722 domain-containing protein [Clostridium weizhouense]MBW6410712.1 DUF523 and DUF1722 domain-containing protein [Clostridium weizhouense]
MIDKNKPTILLSRCLEEACRYDGTAKKNTFIDRLKPYVNIITVCPEMDIGLPTPREALRLIESDYGYSLVFSKTGSDLTEKMNKFSDEFIDKLLSLKIDGAILKSKSPSCGINDVKIYKSFGKSAKISKKTNGIFAEKLINRVNSIPIEDDGRLTNFNIREHFLTRLFAMFNFKQVEECKSINELIKFQSEYKYLLMAYSPLKQKQLGRIVSNTDKENIEKSLTEYKELLSKALSVSPSTMRNINMLLHLFGYFSKDLTTKEKAFFLDNLERYRQKKVPFSLPLTIINSWVIRFDNKYLLSQKIFQAFPIELVEVTDSGKGI